MKNVEILGVVIGKCEFLSVLEERFTCFFGFIPNETMYKIFPDFPKEISTLNQLTFNFIRGEIRLTNRVTQTMYEKEINLTNFKETNNE